LDAKERLKFFNQNPTSIIDYPKGIPEIEKYLVGLKNPNERNPEDLLITSFREQSKLITEVAEYIKKENSSIELY